MKLQNKHLLYGLLLFLLVFAFAGYWRNEKLRKTGIEGIAKVFDIKKVKHGKRGSKVSAHFSYVINGVEYKYFAAIKPGVEIGKCYKLIYSSEDFKMVDIDFTEELNCSNY